MKKKLYISISILLVLTLLCVNTNNKKYKDKEDNRSLAVYLENDNGKYSKSTSIPLKDSGYAFNNDLSICDGNTSILWDNELWGLELDNIDRENTKCHLYFDKN